MQNSFIPSPSPADPLGLVTRPGHMKPRATHLTEQRIRDPRTKGPPESPVGILGNPNKANLWQDVWEIVDCRGGTLTCFVPKACIQAGAVPASACGSSHGLGPNMSAGAAWQHINSRIDLRVICSRFPAMLSKILPHPILKNVVLYPQAWHSQKASLGVQYPTLTHNVNPNLIHLGWLGQLPPNREFICY